MNFACWYEEYIFIQKYLMSNMCEYIDKYKNVGFFPQ